MRLSRAPPLRSLRVFCAAARHRSFKVAADDLYLTPSAVSHQIRELEALLGMKLFERKTRALELTMAGHTLLDEVAPLLEALDLGLARIARRGSRPRLRVLVPSFFANELFIPRLGSFCAAYPAIDIQLDTHDPRPSLHPPTADISILLADSPPQGLKVARLFSVTLVAACAREHAAVVARLGRHVFDELALIVHKPQPFAWSNWAEEIGLDTPEPKHVIELDTMSAVVRAAEAGLGIALVPELLCGGWFRTGALVRIFTVGLPISDTYFLVCRPKDIEKADIAMLMEWAVEEFSTIEQRKPALMRQEPALG